MSATAAEAEPAPSLLEALRVEAVAPGRYRVVVPPAWDAPVMPSGGVTTAVALAAMKAELGNDGLALRTSSTMFVSTVASGELEATVEVLRLGRRMSHLRATVRHAAAGGEGHVVTAAFGEDREGFLFTASRMPDAPPPEQCEGMPVPPAGVRVWNSRFFANLDIRRVRMFWSFEKDWQGGNAETIRWMRYRVAPRLPDGRIEPLALVPLADTMPPSLSQFFGPGFRFFHAPSVDLHMRFYADTEDEWVLVHARAHAAGGGYASAEVSLWDRSGRLLANGDQSMLLRFPEPAEAGFSR